MKVLLELISFLNEKYLWIHEKNRKFVVFGVIGLGLILFSIPSKLLEFIGMFLIFGTLFLLFMFHLNDGHWGKEKNIEEDKEKPLDAVL